MAKESKKKKNSFGWWWLVFVVVALISQASENVDLRRAWLRFRVSLLRSGFDLQKFLPILVGIVGLVIIGAILSAAARRRAEAGDRRPASARTSAAAQRRDPRTKSFTKPEAYCVSCDFSGEDHFRHDREQRIRQLDEWLKNGLIDRAEYKVLLDRFQRDL
ncbi:MAG: hypothetical protein IKO83_11315 [Oscillospiraceae bacterium]|nr:hypothetical protein [Oscillospiraceae bacterium]